MTPRTRVRIGLVGLCLMGWCIAFVFAWALMRPAAVIYPVYEPKGLLPDLPYVLPVEYATWVIHYCYEAGVPVWIACRLFARESQWNPKARGWNENGSVDIGIAQLNSDSMDTLSLRYNEGKSIDPTDPDTAIRVGIRYIER